ncbi:hypothetical protein CHISP_1526 [Chitinispirillum alkaliphilum]|nr:hypothetical protein CHISP_1526 [Chitinispirillum alkaliphilum]
MKSYLVKKASRLPGADEDWENDFWSNANTAEIASFRPESSDHYPRTLVKLAYTEKHITGIFCVNDRYVRCVHTRYMDPVYTDSCVEFFIKPNRGHGYFNFEFNCGGAFLSSYIVDPARTSEGFRDYKVIPWSHGENVKVFPSMPPRVDPEIVGAVTWQIQFIIPFSFFEHYSGKLEIASGMQWSGNFYKCGDATSHPHWASWSPVKELNFHMPECFGRIEFE